MGIVVALDDKQLALAKRLMGPKQLRMAMKSAVGQATRKGRTMIRKEVGAILNVKAGTIAEAVTSFTKNNSDKTPVGIIRVSQKPIPLIDFKGARAGKRGVAVTPIKGKARQVWRHGFAATMKSGHKGFFKRSEKGRVSPRWQRGRSGNEIGKSYYTPGGVTPRGIAWGLKIDELRGPSVRDVMDVPAMLIKATGAIADDLGKRFLSQFSRFGIAIPTSEAA